MRSSTAISVTAAYSDLWDFVRIASDYREALAWCVWPARYRPIDVVAVRIADVTTKPATLERLTRAPAPPAPADLWRAAVSWNFAEALARLYLRDRLSPLRVAEQIQLLDDIQKVAALQKEIADSFYARVRFGRVVTLATGLLGLVALPKDAVERYLWHDYAQYALVVVLATLGVLAASLFVTKLWPERLAARRRRQTRLFEAVVVYLNAHVRRTAAPAAGSPAD